ncbi:MAG: hypothetical protein FH748_15415 [Balneolaceae bacterium]|nr:hypothetical protein [Balneolaceae bacterium]
MDLRTYFPSDFLKPFVNKYMIIESEHEVKNHVLPDTSVVMAFRLSGNISYREKEVNNNLPNSVVTGLRKTSRQIVYTKNQRFICGPLREKGIGKRPGGWFG